MTSANSPVEWTVAGVLDEIGKLHSTMQDRALAFVLGSGASFSSGIPTGKTMAESWLKELHLRECCDGAERDQWLASGALGIKNLTWDKAAEFYPQIFERRFRGDPESGFASLETAMDGKEPSLGYSLLAEIMQHTRHKVVVTTNFDNLVADALAIHAHKPPLIVGHESLTGYVRPLSGRPLVAKIHRDLFYHPKNDEVGVSTLEQGWQEALTRLFKHYMPLVIGYGGNDGSLMGFLNDLKPGDINGRIFWCYRAGSPPSQAVRDLLLKLNGVMVAIPGFDEFMLQLAEKLIKDFDMSAISERIEARGKKRAESYREQAENLQKKSLASTTEPSEGQLATRRVLADAFKDTKNWWAWNMRAKVEADPEKRDRIYREGIDTLPDSAELAGSYANFLRTVRKDDVAAEALYKKALELDPNHATNTGNYASFLSGIRKDYDAAEALYKKALELDPNHATNSGNYANFLRTIRKDYAAAEALYKKVLELDPNHATNSGNYANFLSGIHKSYDAAEALYKKALELDPNSANNHANLAALQLLLGRRDAARQGAQQAIKLTCDAAAQATAEALLYLALCDMLDGKAAEGELGRLKSLLHTGYERGSWNFDDLFAATLPGLPADVRALYEALGAAILDEQALPALEQNKLWQQIEVRPWAE
jgi:tetratricopeptide (TPR) repeat protein